VVAFDPRSRRRDLRGPAVLERLRQERPDLALLFPNSLRSAWLAWRSGAPRRVGFARDGRGLLLTDRLVPRQRRVPHPVLDEYLRLAAHLGCDASDRRTEIAVSAEDQRQLEAFWSRHDPGWRQQGVVCLNPGGAFGSSKHWPTENFADLARRIVDHLGRSVLVLCGPAERDEARQIVRLAGRPRVLSLADGPPGIGLTKAAVRSADMLVTTDSGPRHFAQPLGVPCVTLFGATHQAWSDTRDEGAVHLQIRVDCGPCQKRTCPLKHHRCMRDLPIDWAFDAVVSQYIRLAGKAAA
jgi:heptosyltransferase-2